MRLIAVAAAVVVVMTAAYYWMVHTPVRRQLLDLEATQVKILAASVAHQLQTDLAEAWTELTSLAALPILRSTDRKDLDDVLVRAEGSNTYFKKFTVMDRHGRIVSRPGDPSAVCSDRSDRDYVREALQRREGYVGDACVVDGVLSISMAVPILGEDGAVQGVLAGHVDITGQNPRLCSAVTGAVEPEHYQVVLFSRGGLPIADRAGTVGAASFASLARRGHPLIGPGITSIRHARPEIYQVDGARYFGLVCRIKPADWTLLVAADVAPILARVESLVNRLAWLFGVVFLLVVLAVGLYLSHVVRPVTRLTTALVDFGKVGEAQPLPEVSASGEVGEALLAFNQMVIERSEVEAHLLRQRRELQALTSELARTEQRMRHEIAGELHDHISQNLAASKIRLEMLRSKQSSAGREDSLRVAIDLLRECIHSTSDLTRKLAQPALAQLGLVQALGALVAEYQADHPVTFVFEGCEPIDDLDGAVADTVYRGVGELLHNIIKHAGATRASVRLSRAGSRLRIQVVDDGVGLRVDDLGPRPGGIGGFGLSSLRERLREAGGTLAIHSSPGSGCSVIFEIPIDGAGLQETG